MGESYTVQWGSSKKESSSAVIVASGEEDRMKIMKAELADRSKATKTVPRRQPRCSTPKSDKPKAPEKASKASDHYFFKIAPLQKCYSLRL